MYVEDIDQLDTLTDDQLWEVAADTRVTADIRHEAIGRWLFPENTNPDADPDDLDGGRLAELKRRATPLDDDEIEEDDVEELYQTAPYFDGKGRLLLEHDGVQYLIDSIDDEGAYDLVHDEESLDELRDDEQAGF